MPGRNSSGGLIGALLVAGVLALLVWITLYPQVRRASASLIDGAESVIRGY